MADVFSLKAVLLCGGLSSRMGSPKHALSWNGKPVYFHLTERIKTACPDFDTVYMSFRDHMQATICSQQRTECLLFDATDGTSTSPNIGPAAGLLAAHRSDKDSTWLVVACDYPLVNSSDIRRLIDAYEPPLTCFENEHGWPEPLLAIWSPEALQRLEQNVQRGFTGPIHTLKALPTKKMKPLDERSLMNSNTPADWATSLRLAEELFP